MPRLSRSVVLACLVAAATGANATTVWPVAAAEGGTLSVQINGADASPSGAIEWASSPDNPAIYMLQGAVTWTAADGSGSLTIDSGTWFDPDPVLAFSASATNSSGLPMLYSFAFNAPLAPNLTGAVDSHSELRVALTDGDHSPANTTYVLPTPGSLMLTSYDFAGSGPISKNVDVGPAFYFDSTNQGLAIFQKSSSLSCDQTCTQMSAQLSFYLSPHDSVGLSGLVEQTAVPLPAALPLLGSALGLLGLASGRRRHGLKLAAA